MVSSPVFLFFSTIITIAITTVITIAIFIVLFFFALLFMLSYSIPPLPPSLQFPLTRTLPG